MKTIFAVALALALSACSDTDFFGDSSRQTEPVASAPAEAAPAPMQQAALAPVATISTEQTPVAQDTQASAAPVAQANTSSNAHCKALAKQRAGDAAFEGEDSDTQEAVYKGTYADCVAWDLKHNL
jgi:hypothetical protein